MLGFFALRILALASGLATFQLSLGYLSAAVAADSRHQICIDGMQRSYLIHLPPCYDPTQGNPLVLVLHGAASNANWVATGRQIRLRCRLSQWDGMRTFSDLERWIPFRVFGNAEN
jgi:hypothetical protein